MSQSDRAIKKLATQLARIDREVKSWRGAQADYTSIEAGTMDINDSDGNLVSRVGYQEDGSGAVRFFDGPVPPVPSGVTATSDGPIIQATWDGTFVDGAEATYDLAYLEVAATLVDDDSNVSFATITAKEGASASVVADVTGDWVVAVRSVSQAGKKSEFATAGTVEVKLTDVAGAIEAVQDSANGKNKVTYSSHAPTENDPGIFDDTWFVGQVGRPDDIIEATNLVLNPSADPTGSPWGNTGGGGESVAMSNRTRGGLNTARATLTSTSGYTYLMPGQSVSAIDKLTPVTPGETISASMLVACSAAGNRNLRFGFRNSSGAFQSWSADGPSTALQADGDLVELKIENVTVQSGAAYAYVHTRGPLEGQGNWIEGTHAQVVKSPTVGDYFSGDTEDGETDNESHYRWTGTPHASPSEKYLPALDIGDSDNWNIIEQYRHDGTGWVRVELSHRVFSTVDLGKATVGELDGIRIMAKTISGDLFSGDAFDGIVFRGNTFTTRDGNGEFSDRGLFFQKPDGTSIFRVPTDGTPISMSASDVQIERAQVDELELNYGQLRSGGSLTLNAGVTPPASPPELNASWPRVVELPSPGEGVSINGFTAWGNKWVRALNVRGAAEGDRLEIYTPDGEVETSIPLTMNPHNGCTVLGDVCYVLGHQHGRPVDEQRVHGYDLTTGERVTNWVFTRFYASNQKPISIGNDGSNILVAGVAPEVVLYVMRYNPTTGAQIGSDMVMSPESSYHFTVNGVSVTGGKLYVSAQQTVREYVESGGAWSFNGFAWDNPNKDGAGFVFVDDCPYVVDGTGTIREGSARASDYTAELCFTWYDGTHETTASPVATIDVGARETVTASLPVRAGLQKRLYSRAAGGSNWSRSVVPADVTVSPAPAGIAEFTPPSTNTFPNADPATLKSTNSKFVVNGDGSGVWGPLTFNADGTMSSSQIPAWVPVTTFTSGFGPNSAWGFVPAYRIWPDGKVEWRGTVAGTISGTTDIFAVPTAARPAQGVNVAVASQGAAGTSLVKRMEFSSLAAPTMCRVYRGDSDGGWVSLDNVSYYLN